MTRDDQSWRDHEGYDGMGGGSSPHELIGKPRPLLSRFLFFSFTLSAPTNRGRRSSGDIFACLVWLCGGKVACSRLFVSTRLTSFSFFFLFLTSIIRSVALHAAVRRAPPGCELDFFFVSSCMNSNRSAARSGESFEKLHYGIKKASLPSPSGPAFTFDPGLLCSNGRPPFCKMTGWWKDREDVWLYWSRESLKELLQ